MPTRDDSYVQLLSLAVHEFRSPASVIGGYLRMLQLDEPPLTEGQRKMIDGAERSCQRLVALIAELSEIQKLDADRVELAHQTFDVFPVVAEAAQGVPEADERNVRLEVRGQATGAAMLGDLTRLQRAFTAIFHASLRETPSNTTVVVERRLVTRDGADSAILIVAAEPDIQSVYEADAARFDEKRGGVGLSLPIARRVIERHGGRIWSPTGDLHRSAAIVSLPLSG
jgi:signal transduction histidine kinase